MIVRAALSGGSMRSAADALRAYAGKLAGRCDELAHGIADFGAEMAALEGAPVSVIDRLGAERTADGAWATVAEGDEVAFLEFGTGTVGEGTYPGNLPDDWEYLAMWTPAAHLSSDPSWWFYYDEGHRRHKTQGNRARGFMAAAAEDMRQSVPSMAMGVFRR